MNQHVFVDGTSAHYTKLLLCPERSPVSYGVLTLHFNDFFLGFQSYRHIPWGQWLLLWNSIQRMGHGLCET